MKKKKKNKRPHALNQQQLNNTRLFYVEGRPRCFGHNLGSKVLVTGKRCVDRLNLMNIVHPLPGFFFFLLMKLFY
jgi:hypothetical protein